jgi:hypothetical protein
MHTYTSKIAVLLAVTCGAVACAAGVTGAQAGNGFKPDTVAVTSASAAVGIDRRLAFAVPRCYVDRKCGVLS